MKYVFFFLLALSGSSCVLAQSDSSMQRDSSIQQDSSTIQQSTTTAQPDAATQQLTLLQGTAEGNTDAKNRQVYKIKSGLDIPITVVGGGWTLYAFSQIYHRDRSTEAQINALNPDNINGFDRWAYKVFHDKAATTSDYFLAGSIPLPLFLLFDKSIRHDFGKVGLLYLEAAAITGTLYSTAAISANRYRPYAYNPEAPIGLREGGGAKNSFFAGHVALVATSTFFVAKVFSDYHPDSKLRPFLWGGAIVATGMTGYLRHRGGRHFPSDILVGTAVGTLSGILVPQFHKIKLIKNQHMTLLPYVGSDSRGLAMLYRL